MAKDNEAIDGNITPDAEGAKLNATRLVEGVRDFFLRSVRENGLKKPWQKMSEGEQNLEIERATDRASQLVGDLVDIIASGDFPVVHAIIDNYQSKNGEVKIVAKGVASDEVILNLHHAGKKAVKIVVADRSQFDQSRTNLKGDPDEPGLPGVKQELTAAEVNGEFETEDEPKPTDSTGAEFDDAAEQAAGDAVLDLKVDPEEPPAPTHGPITDMKGFPDGPMQAMRDGKRWWSDDGREWREATDEDVLPTDVDDQPVQDLAFEPDEMLPGVDDVAQDPEPDAGFVDDPAPEVTEDPPAGGEGWPDDAQIAQRSADVQAEGGNADPATGEVLPLNDTEADEIRAEGRKARKNGDGPKKNPHPAKSERAKAWLEGYNAEKADEAKGDKGDAEFDS